MNFVSKADPRPAARTLVAFLNEKWNSSAKKYINTCAICGYKGYNPIIEQNEFCKSSENRVIYKELTKILYKMQLDELGRCENCVRVQNKIINK